MPGSSRCRACREARDLPVLGICRGHAGHGRRGGRLARPARPRRRGPRRALPAAGGVRHAPRHPGARAPGWPTLLGTEALDVPTYHHQAVRPESLEGTAYRPVRVARRRDPRGDGGPRHPASGWRCSGTPRRATTGGCSTPSWPRPLQARASDARSPLARSQPRPGDNRPMTKLNRLAIAAGAASALGALAAAGKGVNAAMGGRPAGRAARAGAALPGLPGGRLPQHLARHVVDAVGPARRAAPVP